MAVFSFRTEDAQIGIVGRSRVLGPIKYRAKPPSHIRLSGAQPHFAYGHIANREGVLALDRQMIPSAVPRGFQQYLPAPAFASNSARFGSPTGFYCDLLARLSNTPDRIAGFLL